jgi:hypothetical protein
VLPVGWFDVPGRNPVGLVLSGLTVSIGFPFLVLSAGAPLLQKWFAHCEHRAARDPYFLYAASNCGSIAGLLAYPLLLEPRLTKSIQWLKRSPGMRNYSPTFPLARALELIAKICPAGPVG